MDFFHGLFCRLMETITGYRKIGPQTTGLIADSAIKSSFVSFLAKLGYESPADFERPSPSSPSNDFTFRKDAANDIAGLAFGTRHMVKLGSVYYPRRTRIQYDKPWIRRAARPITVEIKTSNFGDGPIDHAYIQLAIAKLRDVISRFSGVIFLFPLNNVDPATSSLLADFAEKCKVPVLVLHRGAESWKRVIQAMQKADVGFGEIIAEAIRKGTLKKYSEQTIVA